MDESQSISVEDYFMGICFQAWNKIAEYDRRVFVYQFAVVHLSALLNETNLSKRKENAVEFPLYISEAILLSISIDNSFFEFAFTLISSFAITEKHKQSEKHASFISRQIFH